MASDIQHGAYGIDVQIMTTKQAMISSLSLLLLQRNDEHS